MTAPTANIAIASKISRSLPLGRASNGSTAPPAVVQTYDAEDYAALRGRLPSFGRRLALVLLRQPDHLFQLDGRTGLGLKIAYLHLHLASAARVEPGDRDGGCPADGGGRQGRNSGKGPAKMPPMLFRS